LDNIEISSFTKIILGLDPGTNVMGWAILGLTNQSMSLVQYGVIHLKKYSTHELKLKKIFERVDGIIKDFKPDEIALEAPFYGKNVQSMLKLGRAQGVAMAAALNRGIPIREYAPKKVKQSVTGNGNASKEQVAKMLLTLLKLKEMPEYLDATDALAVAVTHHYQFKVESSKSEGWEKFVKENQDRIKD